MFRNRMKRDILSFALALAIVLGSLMFSVNAKALEDSQEESKTEESQKESKTDESKAEESSANPAEDSAVNQEVRGSIFFGVEARIYDKETAVTNPTADPYSMLVPPYYAGTALTIKDEDGKTIGSMTINENESGVIFNNLPSGNYRLEVSVAAGEDDGGGEKRVHEERLLQ